MRRARRSGFTVTELVIVVGLIAVLAALLFPVLAKVRAASHQAVCLSRLKQMGTAWTMYVAEHGGRVPEYVWQTPAAPDVAYAGYWFGVLNRYDVKGDALICPAASEPTASAQGRGYGGAGQSWTGRYASNGSAVRYNATTYRVGSYGYNRYLTAGGGFAAGGASRLNALRSPAEVPAFVDCAYADTRPANGSQGAPVESPPNLRGDQITPGSPEHWKFLLARHGRGINACMADGSARWVALEDTYTLSWKNDWAKYPLSLPGH
jgi:prepilin-type processing-associated H-X9-DG protein